MAEVTGGRGTRPAHHVAQPQETPQRPSTAAGRLQSRPAAESGAAGASPPSAQRVMSVLASFERPTAGVQPAMFPTSESLPRGGEGAAADQQPGARAGGAQRHQWQRPKSAAPLRTSGVPQLLGPADQAGGQGAAAGQKNKERQMGRMSLYDHGTAERAPHEVPGPAILRDLDKPRMGFPSRPPEKFLKAGEGLSLWQRNKLKEHLRRHPVDRESPFQPGSGGVQLAQSPRGRRPAARPPRPPLPASLLRTYYDNGTLDFVAVRWRGHEAGALVWARSVTKGTEGSRSYTAWAPEAPAELDLRTWLPIFIDGVREFDEPYRFLAIRGSEDLMYRAGGTLHQFADELVAPFRAVLDTREPTCVAVALQLLAAAVALDPPLAAEWARSYWQFAQVINLFRSRGSSLVVDMGYNSRQVASCRTLANDFLTAFELAGGNVATAAVRRYSPGHDPAVTDASMARAAAKAAVKAVEAGLEPGTFKPFTLF